MVKASSNILRPRFSCHVAVHFQFGIQGQLNLILGLVAPGYTRRLFIVEAFQSIQVETRGIFFWSKNSGNRYLPFRHFFLEIRKKGRKKKIERKKEKNKKPKKQGEKERK